MKMAHFTTVVTLLSQQLVKKVLNYCHPQLTSLVTNFHPVQSIAIPWRLAHCFSRLSLHTAKVGLILCGCVKGIIINTLLM